MKTNPRSSLSITLTVWRALFLREAISRLSARRGAGAWILLEPVVNILFLLAVLSLVRVHSMAGADLVIFVMIGLIGFFMTRNPALRGMEAVNANTALFAYRQVRPIDTVLVRCLLEGVLMLLVLVILLAGATLTGHQGWPQNPLPALAAFAGLWLLGVSLALPFSVAGELVPELRDIINMIFRPLYLISGVMFPILAVPEPHRDWLLLNPMLHGLEVLRTAWFTQYHTAAAVSLFYLYACALALLFLGLLLQLRFKHRLVAQ